MKKTDDNQPVKDESQDSSEETSNPEKPVSKKRKIVGGIFRVIFPFRAMRESISVAKRSYQQSKDNLKYIRELKEEAREAIKGSKNRQQKNDQFETTMKKFAPDFQTENDAYSFFLKKKRILLLGAFIFLTTGVLGLCVGFIDGAFKAILLSSMSLASSQPLFFILALSAQLRLWQLETRRLSVEERGGLQDFIKERRGWYWEVIDPQFGYKSDHPNPVVKEIKND